MNSVHVFPSYLPPLIILVFSTMKVLEVCQTPMLASEVYELMKSDPKNEIAFLPMDPLDNPNISDPDHLRRLVSARRICGFLEDTYHVHKVPGGSMTRVRVAKQLHADFALSMDIITRLIDSFLTLQGSKVYIYAILRDLINAGAVTMDQVDGIHSVLSELLTAQEPDEPPSKRKSRSSAK